MIVEKRHVERGTLLVVEGVIKLGQSAQFLAEALKKALAEEEGDVLLDLSGINYIDSTGIGELVGYLVRFRDQERRLVLIQPSERIRKLLRIANVEELFPIFEDVEAALRAQP